MAPAPRMTEVPPTRYRVIERGRRLEVVDTWQTARPPSVTPPPRGGASPATRLPRGVERTRFDGGGVLTTHALYDRKAPRRIVLGAVSAATIARVKLIAIVAVLAFVAVAVWQPVVLIAGFALFQKVLRDKVRDAVTRWLDRVERATS